MEKHTEIHRGKIVPKGAVILNEIEVLKIQTKAINKKPISEVWALRYGTPLLGLTASFSGIFFNNYYRSQVKLKNIARLSTYLPVVGLPFLIGSISHSIFVTNDLLILKTPCSVCLELRATALQLSIGLIYPLILSPLAAFNFAISYATYPLPNLITNRTEVFNIWKKMTLRITPQIGIIAVTQAVASATITYFEWKESVQLLQDSFDLNVLKQ